MVVSSRYIPRYAAINGVYRIRFNQIQASSGKQASSTHPIGVV
jgi:hypothetical protein